MLDALTLPPLPALHGERVILRGPRDSDVDDRLRHPIDPEEGDSYGSAWRRRWDGRRYHTREYLTAGRPGENAADVLASFAEEALVSRMEPLPCNYQDVLAELGVLGSPEAVSALHLAHAVAEITSASGDAYLKRLKEAWTLLRS